MASGSKPGEHALAAAAAGDPQPSSSKPGEQALAVAAAGGSQLAPLGAMPPPPARPHKRKQVVLDEDEWTTSLEAIIEVSSRVDWVQRCFASAATWLAISC